MGTMSSRHRGAGPTLARLISIRVLERVERVRAFADLSLHHALVGLLGLIELLGQRPLGLSVEFRHIELGKLLGSSFHFAL